MFEKKDRKEMVIDEFSEEKKAVLAEYQRRLQEEKEGRGETPRLPSPGEYKGGEYA